jgi:hypothetical protein
MFACLAVCPSASLKQQNFVKYHRLLVSPTKRGWHVLFSVCTVTCMSDYRRVWVIGFIENLQIVTTRNYSAFINLHTLQLTTERTKPSQYAVSSLVVAWWQVLTMSSASMLTFLPAGDCPTTNPTLLQLSCLQHIGTDHTENTVPLLLLPLLCRVSWDVHVIATQPLPSNGRSLESHYLATAFV